MTGSGTSGPQDPSRPAPASPAPEPPPKKKLVAATLAALALAGVILVTVVLPAEYDIDPLGTGEALGLVVLGGGAGGEIPVRSDGITARSGMYRVDRRSFELEPGEFVEYKYRLEEGRTMLYSWTASYWVRSEMHAEANDAPAGTAEFFEIAEEALQRHGRYTAPFSGIHGWYWLNEGEEPVTITLHAAGFFDTAVEYPDGAAPVTREVPATPGELTPPAPDTPGS